jgi:hypothetical protein
MQVRFSSEHHGRTCPRPTFYLSHFRERAKRAIGKQQSQPELGTSTRLVCVGCRTLRNCRQRGCRRNASVPFQRAGEARDWKAAEPAGAGHQHAHRVRRLPRFAELRAAGLPARRICPISESERSARSEALPTLSLRTSVDARWPIRTASRGSRCLSWSLATRSVAEVSVTVMARAACNRQSRRCPVPWSSRQGAVLPTRCVLGWRCGPPTSLRRYQRLVHHLAAGGGGGGHGGRERSSASLPRRSPTESWWGFEKKVTAEPRWLVITAIDAISISDTGL